MKKRNVFQKLDELRRARGLSWYRIARVTGLNASTFTRWSKGGQSPDLESLWKLADFFGTTIDQLVGRLPTPPHALVVEADAGEPPSKRERGIINAYNNDDAFRRVCDTLISANPDIAGDVIHTSPRASKKVRQHRGGRVSERRTGGLDSGDRH